MVVPGGDPTPLVKWIFRCAKSLVKNCCTSSSAQNGNDEMTLNNHNMFFFCCNKDVNLSLNEQMHQSSNSASPATISNIPKAKGEIYRNKNAVAPFLRASGGINGGSAGGGSEGSGWTSFLLGVLADESHSTRGTTLPSDNGEGWTAIFGESASSSSSGNPSVHFPENRPGEVGAGPSNPPMEPYPFHPDEVIGGDCVNSIQLRLLQTPFPSAQEIEEARIHAEDLFEVKVGIIREMAPLDPEGDWEGKGARALDNPRTATGETAFEKLYTMLEDLQQNGRNSNSFQSLKWKVPLKRRDIDDQSTS